MAATIPRASDPSAIADTMSTTMASDDAVVGIKTVPVADPTPSVSRLSVQHSARQHVDLSPADDNVTAASVSHSTTRHYFRIRAPPLKNLGDIGEGTWPSK